MMEGISMEDTLIAIESIVLIHRAGMTATEIATLTGHDVDTIVLAIETAALLE